MDGAMTRRLYRREVREQRVVVTPGEPAEFSECVWDGGNYKDVVMLMSSADSESNAIGLRFLARHLATLDFPKRTMYLKRIHDGLPVDETMDAAVTFLRNMKGNGSLPGWSKDEVGVIHSYSKVCGNAGSVSETFDIRKDGNSSIYHYTVLRASEAGPWKLEKAWRTDHNNHTVEEYPVP
jgi:hypothetical protein